MERPAAEGFSSARGTSASAGAVAASARRRTLRCLGIGAPYYGLHPRATPMSARACPRVRPRSPAQNKSPEPGYRVLVPSGGARLASASGRSMLFSGKLAVHGGRMLARTAALVALVL